MFDGERVIPRASVLVRDQKIVSVGVDVTTPAGVEVIPGEGRTLLPGLIDAHTHAFGDALERALVFGVTTELDMFTEHRFAAQMRAEQQSPQGAPRRADLLSAGTLVTAPGGHGTEYGMKIPTIAAASAGDPTADITATRRIAGIWKTGARLERREAAAEGDHDPGTDDNRSTRPFTAGPDWREFVMPLDSFSNIDGSDLRGVLFSAGGAPGTFRFAIDEVKLR